MMPPRRLTPDEAALWARVAAAVRPLPGRVRPLQVPLPRPITDRIDAPLPPRPRPVADRAAVDAATLDGGWDRRLRTGSVVPEVTIDLHGCTRDSAHDLLTRRIVAAADAGVRVILVITGKGGRRGDDERPVGVLRAGLRGWLHAPTLRLYVAALRPAHPRHGGGGAWYVVLRRR